jgi:hypothetical protein
MGGSRLELNVQVNPWNPRSQLTAIVRSGGWLKWIGLVLVSAIFDATILWAVLDFFGVL